MQLCSYSKLLIRLLKKKKKLRKLLLPGQLFWSLNVKWDWPFNLVIHSSWTGSDQRHQITSALEWWIAGTTVVKVAKYDQVKYYEQRGICSLKPKLIFIVNGLKKGNFGRIIIKQSSIWNSTVELGRLGQIRLNSAKLEHQIC